MNEVPLIFLDVEDVLLIQQDTVEAEGGARGVRDLGLLDAAVMVPRQSYGGEYLHPDLPAMAAAYLFHIAKNHPFVDGNKRAAAMSALVFLDLNGVTRLPEWTEFERVTMAVASGDMAKEALTTWMRQAISV
jgi:death on curing protein